MSPIHSPTSNFAMLRNNNWNVFVKYGLNGKSHAHPDIMNIEVMYKDQRISRDLSMRVTSPGCATKVASKDLVS